MSEPRTCSKCNIEKTTDDFYKRTDRRGPGFDCWCKPCRIANSKRYQATHGVTRSKYVYVRRRLIDLPRDTWEGFFRYMTERPQYFWDIWHMEATESNIKQAFEGVI